MDLKRIIYRVQAPEARLTREAHTAAVPPRPTAAHLPIAAVVLLPTAVAAIRAIMEVVAAQAVGEQVQAGNCSVVMAGVTKQPLCT